MKKINIIVACLALVCFTCSSDDNGNGSPEPVNQPPSGVVLISPTNNGIDKNVSFTYNVPDGDPDGDAIVYDIYLDNGTEELKIAENHNEETFVYDEVLGLNRNYTWHVVAKDGNGGETESETFSFKTRKATYESGAASYLPRMLHSTVLYDENFVIIGGIDENFDLVTNSRKSLNGFFWEAAPSNIPVRINAASVVLNSNIYTVGGWDTDNLLNDVYQLSNLSGGSTWDLVTENASFSPRRGHTLVVFNDKMYLIGGRDGVSYFEDVFRSGNGTTWELETTLAEFGPRAFHTSVVFDNKIWVIAGLDGANSRNDVWYSENGTDWTMATANAEFTPRSYHASVVYDNKIWVYGGIDDSAVAIHFGDLWYSEDGVSWHEAKFEADGIGELPVGLSRSSLVVKDDAMYVIGGRDNADAYIDYTIKIQ